MNWVIPAGWLLGWVLLWRLPHLDAPRRRATATPDVSISVVIPARNEADRMPGLLAALDAQHHRPLEVIVVDDHSSDGTGETAAAHPGTTVIQAPDLPAEWGGKNWACHNGALAARGDLLVFVDADVLLGPDALDRLATTWIDRGGLVSVQPRHDIERPVETLSMVFNIVAMMGLGIGSIIRPHRQWGAAGPLLAISRRDYEQIDGHRSVRGDVAEDLALADRCRRNDIAVTTRAGDDDVRFRMYRNGRELLVGWSKNIATGARRTPLWRRAATALWVAALLAVIIEVVAVVARGGRDADIPVLVAAVAATLQMVVMGRQVGRFRGGEWAWPLAILAFFVIFVRSTVRTAIIRRVTWSGRDIVVSMV